MSLFGSSSDDSNIQNSNTPREQKSLFDDEQARDANATTSLFQDNGDSNNSPWGMPAKKKAGKSDLVRSLLPAAAVPESYVDAFDGLLASGYKVSSGKISSSGARKLLAEGTGLEEVEQDRIFNIVSGGQDVGVGLGQNEINVLIALLGLAQEHEEATLDGVDERRANLPQPSLPLLHHLHSDKVLDSMEDTPASSGPLPSASKPKSPRLSPPKSRRLRKDSLENVDADPWASPGLHKGHTHTVYNDATPSANANTAARPLTNGSSGPLRTTSTFTTHADEDTSNPTGGTEPSAFQPSDGSGAGWGSYENPGGGFGSTHPSALNPTEFGSGGDDQAHRPGDSLGRSPGAGRTANRGIEENVTVTLLPEKEGIFLFQHRNYEIKSTRRASSVIRRYSDFVWLLDCYIRGIPSDNYRSCLQRPSPELAALRKQATKSVQEEFAGKTLPPGLEDSLPTNLLETFETVRSGVRSSAEAYIGLCNLLERMNKRNQGVAADHLRFAQALTSLTETSESTYAVDTNDVPLLNEGIKATAKHLVTTQSLLEDESRAWDEGVLEDLKQQRDALVSVRDMFDRRDRYAKDNIPQLERRIESNENKLAGLMRRPEGAPVKPGEQEKLEQAVRADKQNIVEQHARGVFIKECIRDELIFFQQSQYHISRLHQDWSQERVKYAELQADNWRALSEEVDNMPNGE